MPEYFIADIRKRPNADSIMPQQAIPQGRELAANSAEVDPLAAIFSDMPDDPVACPLPGCDNITMEWTVGSSAGQIDFYAAPDPDEEPARFLSLYILSGIDAAEDQQALKPLTQYADFAQCREFPLVLHVTDDPLSAAWQHRALDSVRKNLTAIVAAFLKAHFPATVAETKPV